MQLFPKHKHLVSPTKASLMYQAMDVNNAGSDIAFIETYRDQVSMINY